MRWRATEAPGPATEWVSPVVRFWVRHRWIRVTVVLLLVVQVVLTVWFQVLVRPHLTASEFRIWRVGEEQVTVRVDEAADVMHLVAGRGSSYELFVAAGALLVRADEIGASGDLRPWVRVPLRALDSRFGALTAARVTPGISVGVKDCEAIGADTVVLVAVALGAPLRPAQPDDRVFVCGDAMEKLSGAEDNVFVRDKAVRPGRVGEPPAESDIVGIEELEDAARLIEGINARLG